MSRTRSSGSAYCGTKISRDSAAPVVEHTLHIRVNPTLRAGQRLPTGRNAATGTTAAAQILAADAASV
jgi:hypothetical protein